MTLHSSIKAIGTVAAQVVQAIAIVELPHNQWPELIGLLLGFVNQDNINLRVATLQAIGFICESIVRRSLFQLFLCDYKFNLSPQLRYDESPTPHAELTMGDELYLEGESFRSCW